MFGGMERGRRLSLILWWVVALAILAFLLVQAFTTYRDRASRADDEAERARRDRARIEECVAAVAARDPRSDAQADYQRGDATPIAHTNFPHEGEITTSFPGAPQCEPFAVTNLESLSRTPPDGKWLRSRSMRFDFQAPAEQHRCDGAIIQYVTAYNERMAQLAAGPVARFCREQRDRGTRPPPAR